MFCRSICNYNEFVITYKFIEITIVILPCSLINSRRKGLYLYSRYPFSYLYILGECIALWGEPNELSIQYRIYIFIQYVDS